MATRFYSKKTCLACGEKYTPTGANQVYCADCRREQDLQRMRNRHYRTYIRKGYSQGGMDNNIHKAGTGNGRVFSEYSQYKLDFCEQCGRSVPEVRRLVAHHRDGDHTNNIPANLITLCDTCHKLTHSGKISV